jgi:hypothetical protein
VTTRVNPGQREKNKKERSRPSKATPSKPIVAPTDSPAKNRKNQLPNPKSLPIPQARIGRGPAHREAAAETTEAPKVVPNPPHRNSLKNIPNTMAKHPKNKLPKLSKKPMLKQKKHTTKLSSAPSSTKYIHNLVRANAKKAVLAILLTEKNN